MNTIDVPVKIEKRNMDTLLVIEGTGVITGGKLQTLSFHHGLGRTPVIVQIQFSPNSSFDEVFILQWPYSYQNSHGPVTISADLQNVYLAFTNSAVFGAWHESPGQWQTFNSGYIRIAAF